MADAIAAVLAFNQPALSKSMLAQLGPSMVLVDNGSAPPQDEPCEIVRQESNGMFVGGWNFAMERLCGRADWIWMLNSDVTGVSEAMLDMLVAKAKALESCAIVSPAYNSPHPHMQNRGTASVRQVRWIDWTAPLVSTAWWLRVGPFDARLRGYGADLDWCKRARGVGARFYVDDGLSFHHLNAQTAIAENMQHLQGDVWHMNNVLREKWGVSDWTKMQ